MKKLCIALRFILVTASLLGLASCKKNNDVPEVTVQNLSGTYTVAAYTFKSGNQPEENLFALMDACEKDNPVILKSDGTYNITDAGIVCTPPENFTSTWSLPNANTIILNGETNTIKSWNGSQLVLNSTEMNAGVTEVTTYTLNKQ